MAPSKKETADSIRKNKRLTKEEKNRRIREIQLRESIGKNLRALREKEGLTQDEFAKKIECSRDTIANYENNRSWPSHFEIDKICRAFKVTPSIIYGYNEIGLTNDAMLNLNDVGKKLLMKEGWGKREYGITGDPYTEDDYCDMNGIINLLLESPYFYSAIRQIKAGLDLRYGKYDGNDGSMFVEEKRPSLMIGGIEVTRDILLDFCAAKATEALGKAVSIIVDGFDADKIINAFDSEEGMK